MSEHEDPIAPTLERLRGYATVALTVAARIAEVAAHRRATQLRQAQQVSEQYTRQVQDQQRAEAAATRHQLRDVGSKAWWDKADVSEAAAAYATARAYGRVDPELYGTAVFMAEQIRERYGVDADRLVEDAEHGVGAVRGFDTFDHPVAAPTAEATGRLDEVARRAAAERAEATALLAEANGIDGAVRADGVVDAHERWHDMPVADADWDDAVRHETLARRLETAMPDQPEAVSARLTIDAAQGKPATAATTARPTSKAPAARPPRVKGAERIAGR